MCLRPTYRIGGFFGEVGNVLLEYLMLRWMKRGACYELSEIGGSPKSPASKANPSTPALHYSFNLKTFQIWKRHTRMPTSQPFQVKNKGGEAHALTPSFPPSQFPINLISSENKSHLISSTIHLRSPHRLGTEPILLQPTIHIKLPTIRLRPIEYPIQIPTNANKPHRKSILAFQYLTANFQAESQRGEVNVSIKRLHRFQ
jgi:hypothetical protein